MSAWQHIFFAGFVVFSGILRSEYNEAVQKPYADETCHIKQVRHYCNGTFDKWENYITTLPGLYYFSIGALKPVTWMLGITDDCTIFLMRNLSLLCGFAIFILLNEIISLKYPEVSSLKRAFHSLTLSTFPMLYFYHFKYYTESLSMMLLLLMHFNHLKGRTGLAAIYGGLGVYTRQSNIIWVFWHAAMKAWEACEDDLIGLQESSGEKSIIGAICYHAERLIKQQADSKLFQYFGRMVVNVVQECFYHLLIGVGFMIFVITNNGIVVGDRKNHVACLNLPQMFYFSAYTGFFLLPVIIWRLRPTLDLIKSSRVLSIAAIFAGLCIVHWKTMMHWYLLTDTSHYIHYVGSALYTWYPGLKYALVPVYFFCWSWILKNLEQPVMEKALLVFSIAISVVPQLLMEFRYFVPGFVFIRLNTRAFSWKEMIGELLFYAVINYITFRKFMYGQWISGKYERRMMW